jgi:Flp pilus assembly protein TadD
VDRVSTRRLAESGDLAAYERLASLDVFDPYAALGLAVAHETAERVEEAEAEIRRARVLFPLGYEPSRALVDFLARNGRIAEALEETAAIAEAHPARAADAAISVAAIVGNPMLAEPLAPRAPSDRRRVAEWMLAQGAPEAALRLVEGADDPASILIAARASISAGRTSQARALLRPISTDPAAALLLADLASSTAEIEEAVAALGAGERDPQVAAKIVALLDRAGRAADAEAKLEALLAAAPDAVPLLELRLERRAARGDLAGAMEDAQRVIELRPHEARGRLALARLYERRGLVAGARELYAEALQVAPENAEARAALARLAAP